MNTSWSLCWGCHRGRGHSLLPATIGLVKKNESQNGEIPVWGSHSHPGESYTLEAERPFDPLTRISRGLYIWPPPMLSP